MARWQGPFQCLPPALRWKRYHPKSIHRQRHWSALKSTLELEPHEHSDPPKMTVIMFTVEAGDGRISSPTLRTGVTLYAHWSPNMTARVCERIRLAGLKWSFCFILQTSLLVFLIECPPPWCASASLLSIKLLGEHRQQLVAGTCLSRGRLPLGGYCRSSCVIKGGQASAGSRLATGGGAAGRNQW